MHLFFYNVVLIVKCRATENRYFAGPDQFLVCKTDSVCIKRIFFGPKKHTLRIIYWPNYLDYLEYLFEIESKQKSTPATPKIGNGVDHLIRMDKPIRQM